MNSVFTCFLLLGCFFFGVLSYPLSFLLFVMDDEKLFSFPPNVRGVVKTTVEASMDIVTGTWENNSIKNEALWLEAKQ